MDKIELKITDYKRIKKIIKDDNNNKEYFTSIKSTTNYHTNDYWLHEIIKALNIKQIDKRYDYIISKMCSLLNDISKKTCIFDCDKCIENKNHTSVHKNNGCCYFNNSLCPYLVNGICKQPNLTCKLFFCEPIERKYHFKSKVENYPLLDLFFNNRQKELINTSFRISKNNLIKELIERQ